MIDDVEKAIRAYIKDVIHLSLATVADNAPWVCELHYAYDDVLNIYFRSTASRRHSVEITKNSRVAGNIVKEHKSGEAVRGVYFEGNAELLTDVDQSHPAYIAYCKRFGTTETILEDAKNVDGHKFYKISVKKFYVFDSVESTPSQKYELPWG